jgi:A/G-specific adenine glycosylase
MTSLEANHQDLTQRMIKIAPRLVAWQRQHGRHGLPWQNTRDPYKVWLSEIMLQQTQVAAVLDYYQRFLAKFPNVEALAQAPADQVMAQWAGLGYYARARNLHACAKQVVSTWKGKFPNDAAGLATLPGIGPSTAAAIAAFCYGERTAILDGNVKRVLARLFAIEGDPTSRAIELQLWSKAHELVPTASACVQDPNLMSAYTQGLMDLGATICTRSRPQCPACPLKKDCMAFVQGRCDELPWPRARKVLPERSTAMLIVCRPGYLLLMQRPTTGIWGGLWSLPECAPELDPEAAGQQLGLNVQTTDTFAEFLHVFTHFRLTIRPHLIQIGPDFSDHPGRAQPLGTRGEWVSIKTLHERGLPAPVRKLLEGLIAANLLT